MASYLGLGRKERRLRQETERHGGAPLFRALVGGVKNAGGTGTMFSYAPHTYVCFLFSAAAPRPCITYRTRVEPGEEMKLKPLSCALLTLVGVAVLKNHGLSSAQEEEGLHQVHMYRLCSFLGRDDGS